MTPAPDLPRETVTRPPASGDGAHGVSAFQIYKTLERLDDDILKYRAQNHLDSERKIIWDLLHTGVKAMSSIAFSLGESGERWG